MKQFLTIAIVICTAAQCFAAPPKLDPITMSHVRSSLTEGRREVILAKSRHAVSLQNKRARTNRKNHKAFRVLNHAIRDTERDLQDLRRAGLADAPFPNLEPTKFRAGQIGHLPQSADLMVMQIITDTEMTIKWTRPTDNKYINDSWYFRINGYNVKGQFADTDKILFPAKTLWHITKTITYTTAIGGTRTVFQLEVFDASRYRAEIAANEPTKKPKAKPVVKTGKKSTADSKLRLAMLLYKSKPEIGRERLQEIITNYPGSDAAKRAKEMLE